VKLSMFGAMTLGVVLAAILLVWEEFSVTLHGEASFYPTLGFTSLSLLAILLFAVLMLKAPDND